MTLMHSWSVMEKSFANNTPEHYSVWIFSILPTNDKTKPRTVKRVMIRCMFNKQSQDSNFIASAVSHKMHGYFHIRCTR